MSQPISKSEANYGTKTTYIAGFGLSILLTGLAFWLVNKHTGNHHLFPTDNFMIGALSVLAVTQLFVQLIFFLHLDKESKPRWNNMVLFFAATVVVIIVFGSVWIMTSLNYHHDQYGVTHDGHALTSPSQTNQYIIHDEGIHQ